jgi:hypothetical protein
LKPQDRLADGVVADGFLDSRIGVETPPEGDILGLVERQ